jgi:hypothetical protein
MNRWIAGAVAVLAAAGGFAAPGLARASSAAWYKTYQVNISGSFSEVAAISETNIWAVGDRFDKKGNPIYRPIIRHFTRAGWETVTIPGSPRFESDHVSASAANNVWVFGLRHTRNSVAASVAYRYDGSRWHKIPVPAETFLQGAVTLGPRNVWAFGDSGTIFAPGSSVSATVFHWNGSRWRGYNVANGNLMGESISASGRNNVWIAGLLPSRSAEHAVAYRWNGIRWHNGRMPRVVPADNPGVSVFSRSNVWVGWDTELSSRVTHWDGHRWHTMTTPSDVDANTSNVVRDGKGGYWFGPFAILASHTWTSEPFIGVTGGFGSLVRIPGTESFILPASVKNSSSAIQKPTLYRFDL